MSWFKDHHNIVAAALLYVWFRNYFGICYDTLVEAPKKRRGTRAGISREDSRLLTRKRLLAAAEVEFAHAGFEGANLRDILARAEVSPGSFYYNFEDKTALFLALVQEATNELLEVVIGLRLRQMSGDFVEQLENSFLKILRFGKKRKNTLIFMYREALSGNPKILEFVTRSQQAYIDAAATELAFLVERKALPAVDTRWAASTIVTYVTGALIQQLRSPVDDDEWKRAMTRFLLGGLPMMVGIVGRSTKQTV